MANSAVVAAYIANNPVKRDCAVVPRTGQWGSHGAVLDGDGPAVARRRGLLGTSLANGGDPYERYIEGDHRGLSRGLAPL